MSGRGGKIDDPDGDGKRTLLAILELGLHPLVHDYTPTTDESETT